VPVSSWIETAGKKFAQGRKKLDLTNQFSKYHFHQRFTFIRGELRPINVGSHLKYKDGYLFRLNLALKMLCVNATERQEVSESLHYQEDGLCLGS
jgi:hypothetical protein